MKKIIIGVSGVVVLLLAYWFISPLWRNVRLDESLPQVDDNQNQSLSMIKDDLNTMDAATKEQFEKEAEEMKDKVMKVEETMPVNQTVVLGEANLVPRAHEVEGKALLVQVGDQKIIRFEDLKTINGPDLRIYLSADLGTDDYVDLGPIRATEGNVNYTVPAGIDTNKYRNVLIWCRAFRVLFSYAQL